MAYCVKCGTYIPDGQKGCLACGYDESSEQAKARAYEREQHGDLREQYEQERRKQQETSRKWAEQEYERRQAAQQQREEELRRQAEQRQQAREATKEQAKYYANRVKDGISSVASSNNRLVAALSYLSILWILPRFLCADDPFARYHARQGLTLFVFSVICDAISAVIPFGGLLNLFRIYCIYKGMTNALNDRMEPLPYIGQFGEKES